MLLGMCKAMSVPFVFKMKILFIFNGLIVSFLECISRKK